MVARPPGPQISPEPVHEEPPLRHRLAHRGGLARCDTSRLLRVDLETTALSALPSTCFRATPLAAPPAPAPRQSLTWVLSAGGSVLKPGAPPSCSATRDRDVALTAERGAEARFSFQTFQARVEGASVIARHTSAELALTPAEEGWTGTLTLSARDECRGDTCQLACEVVLPLTATPVPLRLASAAR